MSVLEDYVWDIIESGAGAHLRPGADSVPKALLAAGLRGKTSSEFCDELARVEMPGSSALERAGRAEALWETSGSGASDGRVRVLLGGLFGHVTDDLLEDVRAASSLVGDEVDGWRSGVGIRSRLLSLNDDLDDDAANAVVTARIAELASDREVTSAVYERAFRELVEQSMPDQGSGVGEVVSEPAAQVEDTPSDGGRRPSDDILAVMEALAQGAARVAELAKRKADKNSAGGRETTAEVSRDAQFA